MLVMWTERKLQMLWGMNENIRLMTKSGCVLFQYHVYECVYMGKTITFVADVLLFLFYVIFSMALQSLLLQSVVFHFIVWFSFDFNFLFNGLLSFFVVCVCGGWECCLIQMNSNSKCCDICHFFVYYIIDYFVYWCRWMFGNVWLFLAK